MFDPSGTASWLLVGALPAGLVACHVVTPRSHEFVGPADFVLLGTVEVSLLRWALNVLKKKGFREALKW